MYETELGMLRQVSLLLLCTPAVRHTKQSSTKVRGQILCIRQTRGHAVTILTPFRPGRSDGRAGAITDNSKPLTPACLPQAYRRLRERFPDRLRCDEGLFLRAVARVQVVILSFARVFSLSLSLSPALSLSPSPSLSLSLSLPPSLSLSLSLSLSRARASSLSPHPLTPSLPPSVILSPLPACRRPRAGLLAPLTVICAPRNFYGFRTQFANVVNVYGFPTQFANVVNVYGIRKCLRIPYKIRTVRYGIRLIFIPGAMQYAN